MTQNNTTATIGTFLKSRYRNPLTGKLDGLAVDEDGNFLHYNTIINVTYNELFKGMELTTYVDDSFKKEFCKHFYNREIGLETFSRFQILLENSLNTKCLNLFKGRYEILNKTLSELNQSMDITSKNKGKGDNQGLGIANTTPQDRLEILFTEKYGVIEHANALQENHGKFETENESNTKGWSGASLGERIDTLANLTDLTYAIFNELDELFLQVW